MKPITGSIVALVTPMHDDLSIDYDALRGLIDWHVEQGTDCIGVVGTTGESPTVTHEEQREIIRVAVKHAAGRVPIMAGAGSNSTAEAVELQKFCAGAGADCTLQVVPYYNKPTQEGLFRHFEAIAKAAPIPLFLYNVPGRSVVDMNNDTVLRLTAISSIVGIKEASGNLERGTNLIALLKRVRPDFAVFSGDDGTAMALMLAGAQGNVSVTANLAPKLMHDMCAAAVAGNARLAQELNARLSPLNSKLFVEPNPTAPKWALAKMGRIKGALRLPLVPLTAQYEAVVLGAMQEVGVI